jgi:bifunctional DNA-binding transcriptional regulator/antitoxin component of YhaV-PrlF toxin-antitoxin module
MTKDERKNGIPRKLTVTGDYTYYVTIPKEYIEELGWKEKQKVTVRLSGKKVVIGGLKG